MDLKLDDSIFIKKINTPLGPMTIKTNFLELLSVAFDNDDRDLSTRKGFPEIMHDAETQLGDYFKGKLSTFTLPLSEQGTSFQRLVWDELKKIEYGTKITYKKMAMALGSQSKTRAVATAIARNPFLVIIPCHRVIGSDGSLTGYAGGIDRKKDLLILECKFYRPDSSLF